VQGAYRLLLVEDTYGVEFHRNIIDMLVENAIVSCCCKPRIEGLPAGKCNQALRRKVLAKVFNQPSWRTLIVIDSERKLIEEAERDILSHFGQEHSQHLKVVIVDPRHEAWLCIGMGLDRGSCRSDPELEISKAIGTDYEKRMLGKLATRVSIESLLEEPDFQSYLEGLRWLLDCSNMRTPVRRM